MQVLFGKYLKEYPPKQTEVYELKICKGTALPFDSVQPHQIDALHKAEAALYYKIPDQPISWGAKTQIRFAAKKPFDCLIFVQAQSFIIVWFYQARMQKRFIKIPIAVWVQEVLKSTRKSLTSIRAEELGEILLI